MGTSFPIALTIASHIAVSRISAKGASGAPPSKSQRTKAKNKFKMPKLLSFDPSIGCTSGELEGTTGIGLNGVHWKTVEGRWFLDPDYQATTRK